MGWIEAAATRGRGGSWVRWTLVLAGLLGAAAGIIVLAEPSIGLATLAAITGIFLVIDGITEIAVSILDDAEHRYAGVLAAVISLLIGVILIRHPIPGVVAVGILLGLWLIAAGVVRLASMVDERQVRGWWLLVAVVEIAAGVVLVASPRIAVSTLALLVGISFIVRGVALATVGWFMVEPSGGSEVPAAGGPVAAT